MKINIILSLVLLSFLFLNCNYTTRTKNKDSSDSSYFSKFPFIQNENNIDTIMDVIRRAECFNERFTGFASSENATYAYYLRLNELISDSAMLKLIDDKSSILQVYAYRALLSRNSNLASVAKGKLESSDKIVCWQSGDTKTEMSIKELIKILKPDPNLHNTR